MANRSSELSSAVRHFADPRFGAVRGINDAVSQMKDNLGDACDHVRAQMNTLGKDLYRTIAVLCCAGLIGGFFTGCLYDRWVRSASSHIEAAPVAEPQTGQKKQVPARHGQ